MSPPRQYALPSDADLGAYRCPTCGWVASGAQLLWLLQDSCPECATLVSAFRPLEWRVADAPYIPVSLDEISM